MNVEHPDHLTEAQLNGAAEGSLASDEARLARRHLEACAECSADVERIRGLLADAASLPRAIEPPDDIWPAIRERVQRAAPMSSRLDAGRNQPLVRDLPLQTADASVTPIRRSRREYAFMAAAALFLVVLSSGITMRVVSENRRVASAPVAGHNDSVRPNPDQIRAVSAEYDRLDRDLARQLDQHREKLQPETIEKVERNLQIIDRAIGEIRQALADDPHNEALEQLLKASYGQKSALLQQVSQS